MSRNQQYTPFQKYVNERDSFLSKYQRELQAGNLDQLNLKYIKIGFNNYLKNNLQPSESQENLQYIQDEQFKISKQNHQTQSEIKKLINNDDIQILEQFDIGIQQINLKTYLNEYQKIQEQIIQQNSENQYQTQQIKSPIQSMESLINSDSNNKLQVQFSGINQILKNSKGKITSQYTNNLKNIQNNNMRKTQEFITQNVQLKNKIHLPKTTFNLQQEKIVSFLRNQLQNNIFNSYKIQQKTQNNTHDNFIQDKQSNEIWLLNSIYVNRPQTIFFQYHSYCGKQRNQARIVKATAEQRSQINLSYKILGSNPYKCVVSAFELAGFKRTEGEEWTCYWGIQKYENLKNMRPYQKNNHFPGFFHVGQKDKLWQHVSQAKRRFHNDYNFMPLTYLMNNDFEKIKKVIQGSTNQDIFILKPVASAKGQGIKLISKKDKIKKKKGYLMSEYIKNPHLINGFKYDLRIYVLVTSYDPLKIYIYKDGLCRFATEQYDTSQIDQIYSHLTNYSINKKNENVKKQFQFVKNKNSQEDNVGSKWSLQALAKYYQQNNIDDKTLFKQIEDIIIKTLIALEPHNQGGICRRSYFEVYGFDILMDDNLKPWLLEINVCCSLSTQSPLDKKIKYMQLSLRRLISDILNLIGFYPQDQNQNQKIELEKKSQKSEKKEGQVKSFSRTSQNIQDLNFNNCIQKLDPESWKILFEFDEEYHRRGIIIIKVILKEYFPLEIMQNIILNFSSIKDITTCFCKNIYQQIKIF